jgi:hypothetical protein
VSLIIKSKRLSTCLGNKNKKIHFYKIYTHKRATNFIERHRLDYANRKFGIRVSDQMPMDDIPLRVKKTIAIDPYDFFVQDFIFLLTFNSKNELYNEDRIQIKGHGQYSPMKE